MICYVDLEHPTLGPSLLSDRPEAAPRKAEQVTWAMRFQEISGLPCLLQHFTQVSPRRLAEVGIRAVIVSGHSTLIDDYDPASLAPLIEVIRSAELPLLGLCGGHQLMGLAFGVRPEPMGPLARGEADPRPELAPGMRKEWGAYPIRILGDDPLFAGLGDAAVVEQRHFWELKTLPEGFVRLAASDACAIQAMRHSARPLYGVQFHPERYSDAHLDGRTIVANFLRLAGLARPPATVLANASERAGPGLDEAPWTPPRR
jgi:GMP synthase-like glutamine amidotransferase